MFNLSTPVSLLPSPPVAFPSHEPDGILPMEQSMVSLEPVKKVDSQRRFRERRDPRRIFRRPPYAHRFPQAQVFFYTQGLAVLCLRDYGFTLNNGVSYALDHGCQNKF
ncbi:hypothetical protein TNCV_2802621 [Trichonephila clavipes]|nr:hypothetical protein TNCV_2802621 [Trichonephila clavipes]